MSNKILKKGGIAGIIVLNNRFGFVRDSFDRSERKKVVFSFNILFLFFTNKSGHWGT